MPRRATTNKGCALLPRTEMPPEILPCTREPDLERHRTLRKSCKIRTLTARQQDGKGKAPPSVRRMWLMALRFYEAPREVMPSLHPETSEKSTHREPSLL